MVLVKVELDLFCVLCMSVGGGKSCVGKCPSLYWTAQTAR